MEGGRKEWKEVGKAGEEGGKNQTKGMGGDGCRERMNVKKRVGQEKIYEEK